MPALQGKLLSLYINPGNRMGLFIDRRIKLLGYRGDFGPAPELTLMASGTFVFIDHQQFHFFLLTKY
jgi:hypothetical protein